MVKAHLSTPSKKQKKLPGQQETPIFTASKRRRGAHYKYGLVLLPYYRYGRRYRKQHRKEETKNIAKEEPTNTEEETTIFKEETTLKEETTKSPTKRKRQSRRKGERSKQRKQSNEEKIIQQHEYQLTKKSIVDTLSMTRKYCIRNYGFVANPTAPLWQNIRAAFKSNDSSLYLQSSFN
jgi:hypothetical protein